jgi:hypothetical protein
VSEGFSPASDLFLWGTQMSAANIIPPLIDRRTVFLSHANPAENEFTRWLALRLANEGYEVWSDLTKLLGGTNWWVDIEHAIREKARKVIFVVSKSSNQADGVLKELSVADTVKRQLADSEFIIPIKTDDLPYRDHNIYINGLNALSFAHGWAQGLADLLHTLQEQGVPKNAAAGPRNVATWWNDHQLNAELVRPQPQKHFTNWFPIRSMPPSIWVWHVPPGAELRDYWEWPVWQERDRLVSFANPRELTGSNRSPTGGRGVEAAFSLDDGLQTELGLDRMEFRKAVKQLLRMAWDKLAEQRKLPMYKLSSRRRTLWFPAGSVSPNGVSFIGMDGNRADRQLYGYKSVGPEGRKYKRFYHFGLEAAPMFYPELMFALKAHVIFTLDGSTPHKDVKYQHRARRSQCKAWWNDRWRDLMLAGITAVANGSDEIALPLCPGNFSLLDSHPVELISPKSYLDADVKEPKDEQIGGDDETEEADLDEMRESSPKESDGE